MHPYHMLNDRATPQISAQIDYRNNLKPTHFADNPRLTSVTKIIYMQAVATRISLLYI